MKKIPLRTCVVTHEKLPKMELVRVVKNNENIVEIDLTGKKNGHGVYLKNSSLVFLKCKKNRVLDRVFEMKIDDSIYDELISMGDNNGQ